MCFRTYLIPKSQRSSLSTSSYTSQDPRHTQPPTQTVHATILDHHGKPFHLGGPYPILRRTLSGHLFQPHSILPPRLTRMKPYTYPPVTKFPTFDIPSEQVSNHAPSSFRSRVASKIANGEWREITNEHSGPPSVPRRSSSLDAKRPDTAGAPGNTARSSLRASEPGAYADGSSPHSQRAPFEPLKHWPVDQDPFEDEESVMCDVPAKRVRFADAPEYMPKKPRRASVVSLSLKTLSRASPVSLLAEPAGRVNRLFRKFGAKEAKGSRPDARLVADDDRESLLKLGDGSVDEMEVAWPESWEGDVWGEIAAERD